jgi:hypothetical protein
MRNILLLAGRGAAQMDHDGNLIDWTGFFLYLGTVSTRFARFQPYRHTNTTIQGAYATLYGPAVRTT